MTTKDILAKSYETFLKDTDMEKWKVELRSLVSNNGLTRGNLECMADFCEQASTVLSDLFVEAELR